MSSQLPGVYDSPVYPDNKYGHALDLLVRRAARAKDGRIHLDIGCGYGRIAERVQSELNRAYVGVDGSADGFESLSERGFESHLVQLEGRETTLDRLKHVVGNRKVGSITFLDVIEHVLDGDGIMQAIAELAREHLAFVVVSTPNIAHRDIGAKLAFGRWDYTDAGILDHTHTRLYDQKLLGAVLENAGLHVVDRYDVLEAESDQHFPEDHPVLARGTSLNQLLFSASTLSNPHATVNQFVWLCLPGDQSDRATYVTERRETRPLVSAIIRTQGRRLHTLSEVLTCLCGQSDDDFDVVVVGHRLDAPGLKAVERVIDDMPEWLRVKIRLVKVQDGGRARPLNVGFENAQGRYIAILDDDDIPKGNWVETFRKLDQLNPGRVLRSACVRQDVVNVRVNGRTGLRASGPLVRTYAAEFDLFDHFIENRSPPISLAFPRGAFHDLGIRFDETLETTEDWDFLMRVAAVCGVASSSTIAGIYRWWTTDESSRTVHPLEEWRQNYNVILRKLDSAPFILPKGEIGNIRRLMNALAAAGNATNAPSGQTPLSAEQANAMRGAVRTHTLVLRAKYWFWIASRKRRRRYRSRIRALRELNEQI